MSQEVVDQKVEALKVEAKAVLEETVKDLAKKINARLLPLAIDVATAKIPGEIDNAVAEVAKPIIKSSLEGLIEAIEIK